MPYTIRLTNGNVFANIADGTINTQASAVLIGKDFAGYGQYIDQNTIRILENGASNTAPVNALTGQLWFDITNRALKVATYGNIPQGSASALPVFRSAAPSYSATAPSGNVVGDLWTYINDDGNVANNVAQLRIYVGGNTTYDGVGNAGWQVIGPTDANTDATYGNLTTKFLVATQGANIEAVRANVVNADNSLLIGQLSGGGYNSNARIDTTGTYGYVGSLQGDQANITSIGNSTVGKLTSIIVGDTAANSSIPTTVITNTQLTTVTTQSLNILSNGTSTLNTVVANNISVSGNIQGTLSTNAQPNITSVGTQTSNLNMAASIIPTANVTYSIGNNTNRFNNVYANTFYGSLQGSIVGDISGNVNAPNSAAAFYSLELANASSAVFIGSANVPSQVGNIRLYGGNGTIGATNGLQIGGTTTQSTITISPGAAAIGSFGYTTYFANIGPTVTTPGQPRVQVSIGDDLVVLGNLLVQGTTTYINSGNITTGDLSINLGNTATTPATVDGGGFILGANVGFTGTQPTFLYSYNLGGGIWNSSVGLTANGNITAATITGYGAGPHSFAGRTNLGNLYLTGSGSQFTGTITNGTYQIYNGSQFTNVASIRVGTTEYTASTVTANSTIALRDSTGNLFANYFNGIATSALYADLAEKYLADQDYEPGTLVTVGGTAEITACGQDQRAIGVISTNPAYMMNSELEGGIYVALKGRVPVKFTGTINKGELLGPSTIPGVATKNSNNAIAIALHTASTQDSEVGTVEAVII